MPEPVDQIDDAVGPLALLAQDLPKLKDALPVIRAAVAMLLLTGQVQEPSAQTVPQPLEQSARQDFLPLRRNNQDAIVSTLGWTGNTNTGMDEKEQQERHEMRENLKILEEARAAREEQAQIIVRASDQPGAILRLATLLYELGMNIKGVTGSRVDGKSFEKGDDTADEGPSFPRSRSASSKNRSPFDFGRPKKRIK